MSIASEIVDLEQNLEAAQQAIIEKGGTVSGGFAGLITSIEELPEGGESGPVRPEPSTYGTLRVFEPTIVEYSPEKTGSWKYQSFLIQERNQFETWLSSHGVSTDALNPRDIPMGGWMYQPYIRFEYTHSSKTIKVTTGNVTPYFTEDIAMSNFRATTGISTWGLSENSSYIYSRIKVNSPTTRDIVLQDAEQFKNLVGAGDGDYTYTVNGESIPSTRVCAFFFGNTPSTLPTSGHIFCGAKYMNYIDPLPSWAVSALTNYAFSSCYSLQEFVLPEGTNPDFCQRLRYLYGLQKLDVGTMICPQTDILPSQVMTYSESGNRFVSGEDWYRPFGEITIYGEARQSWIDSNPNKNVPSFRRVVDGGK